MIIYIYFNLHTVIIIEISRNIFYDAFGGWQTRLDNKLLYYLYQLPS